MVVVGYPVRTARNFRCRRCNWLQWANYNGGVDASEGPELKFLHAETTLNRVKLEWFRSLTTEELISSLAPGGPGAIKVRPDGTVLDGHHRLRVLVERGVDIRRLPREIMERKP